MSVYINPFDEALHNGARTDVTIGVNREAVSMLESELAKGIPMQGTDADALAEMGRRQYRAYSFIHDIHMQMRPQFHAVARISGSEASDPESLRVLLKDARSHLLSPAEGHDDGLLLADLIERIDLALTNSTTIAHAASASPAKMHEVAAQIVKPESEGAQSNSRVPRPRM